VEDIIERAFISSIVFFKGLEETIAKEVREERRKEGRDKKERRSEG
jgi:hypothetical protein